MYRFLKAIANILVEYHSFAMIIAVIISVFNSFFVDLTTGNIGFSLAKSAGAVVNYFLSIGLIVFWLAQRYDIGREKDIKLNLRRELLDDLCENIFLTCSLDSEFRVSIFEENDKKLIVTGRFAQFDSETDTEVEFASNKGCVGAAFYSGSCSIIDNLPNFEEEPDKYYAIMKKKGMTKADINKLHRKNRSYLSIPLRYFNSFRTAAVLCLDCTKPNIFTNAKPNIRFDIEDYMTRLISTFFELNQINK